MTSTTIAGCFRDKSILVTGATGFLCKMVVEKILRVQPDVKKLYLLVRAPDVASAKKRVLTEVVDNVLFSVLREQHGVNFNCFIEAKISPVVGDMMRENFGRGSSEIERLAEEIDVIISGAASTNFYERYDVALASNALGVSYLLQFAKLCANLKLFLHVSTAFVAGEQEGLLLEKPFKMHETLKKGLYMDIEAEVQLAEKVKSNHKMLSSNTSPQLERRAMKELGIKRARHFGWPNTYVLTKAMGEMLLGHLRGDLPVVIVRPSMITSTLQDPMPGWIEGIRTFDPVIIGYSDQTIPCFVSDRNAIADTIPGDMVVNAMMVAMATHWNQQSQVIYHVTSGIENPLLTHTLLDSIYRCFATNPHVVWNVGKPQKRRKILMFKRYSYFLVYMSLVYRPPLEMFHMVDFLSCGQVSRSYNKSVRSYNLLVLMAKFYSPYVFPKGRFDVTNLKRLRTAAGTDYIDASMFGFDPKIFDWESYLFSIHVPAVVEYDRKMKASKAKL